MKIIISNNEQTQRHQFTQSYSAYNLCACHYNVGIESASEWSMTILSQPELGRWTSISSGGCLNEDNNKH